MAVVGLLHSKLKEIQDTPDVSAGGVVKRAEDALSVAKRIAVDLNGKAISLFEDMQLSVWPAGSEEFPAGKAQFVRAVDSAGNEYRYSHGEPVPRGFVLKRACIEGNFNAVGQHKVWRPAHVLAVLDESAAISRLYDEWLKECPPNHAGRSKKLFYTDIGICDEVGLFGHLVYSIGTLPARDGCFSLVWDWRGKEYDASVFKPTDESSAEAVAARGKIIDNLCERLHLRRNAFCNTDRNLLALCKIRDGFPFDVTFLDTVTGALLYHPLGNNTFVVCDERRHPLSLPEDKVIGVTDGVARIIARHAFPALRRC